MNTVKCLPTVLSAATKCNEELEKRLKDFADKENVPDAGKCCWFAAFRSCVWDLAYKECGQDAFNVMDTVVSRFQKDGLSLQCEGYTMYNPVCIFFIYLPYVIIAGVMLALLFIGCCIGACCCRR